MAVKRLEEIDWITVGGMMLVLLTEDDRVLNHLFGEPTDKHDPGIKLILGEMHRRMLLGGLVEAKVDVTVN